MAFPPICLARQSFTLKAVTNSHREVSPYSFKQTPYDFMGGMWTASLDLRSMSTRDRATFLRWLVSLEGAKGTFELLALDYSGPFGTLLTNPTIASTAVARAKTITMTMASGDAFVADDQITIGGHLHIVTSAAQKVGAVQSVTIWPRLRSDAMASDPVEALAPYGTWALASSENGYGVANKLTLSAQLELIEAI